MLLTLYSSTMNIITIYHTATRNEMKNYVKLLTQSTQLPIIWWLLYPDDR